MKFAKHNILISISLVIYVSCFAQREKIDSLINLLSSLHDTIRIDCMNDLCKEYIFKGRKDSAKYYASLAYEESTKLNYIHGIAKAFSNKSQIAKHFDDDFVQSEQYARNLCIGFKTREIIKALMNCIFISYTILLPKVNLTKEFTMVNSIINGPNNTGINQYFWMQRVG